MWRGLVTARTSPSLPNWGGLTCWCAAHGGYCAKQDSEPLGFWDGSFSHLLEYMIQKGPFLCVMAGKRFAVGFCLGTMQASLYVYALETYSLTFIQEKNREGVGVSIPPPSPPKKFLLALPGY